MKILFKYPTRSRPKWFMKTLKTYYDMMSKDCNFQFLLTLDEDDVSMNNPEMLDFLRSQKNLIFNFGKNKSKIDACNADIALADSWDILVLVSDDMIPIEKDFDKIISSSMQKYFLDTDGALHFNDGLFGEGRTITLSILGRKLYNYFGYVYHPSYKSFYCDNEFTEEVYRLQKVIYFPEVIIKHKWSGGLNCKDALYKRNSKMGISDEKIYNRRKLLEFPRQDWSQ